MNPVFLLVQMDVCFKHHLRRVICLSQWFSEAQYIRFSEIFLIISQPSISIETIQLQNTDLYIGFTVLLKAVDQRKASPFRNSLSDVKYVFYFYFISKHWRHAARHDFLIYVYV